MRKRSLLRPSWDEYFMSIAQIVKTRSNCLRDQVGVVIIKNKRIVATGYNGTPVGIKNCFQGGCKRCADRDKNILKPGESKDTCICVHAEQNAIVQSAYHGISTKGGTLYTTMSMCVQCARLIINGGIEKVISAKEYTDTHGLKLLKRAGVEVVTLYKV